MNRVMLFNFLLGNNTHDMFLMHKKYHQALCSFSRKPTDKQVAAKLGIPLENLLDIKLIYDDYVSAQNIMLEPPPSVHAVHLLEVLEDLDPSEQEMIKYRFGFEKINNGADRDFRDSFDQGKFRARPLIEVVRKFGIPIEQYMELEIMTLIGLHCPTSAMKLRCYVGQ